MMKKKGVTAAQINDRTFLTTRFITPPETNHAGIVQRDFPYQFIDEIVR